MATTTPASRTRTRRGAAKESAKAPSYTELPGDAVRLPWTSGEAHTLVVVQEPGHEFYKDQGGKNHHLATLVRLVPTRLAERCRDECKHGTAEPGDPLPSDRPGLRLALRPTLRYESQVQVEDGDILRMMHGADENMPFLELKHTDTLGWCYEAEVKFRLEKVSFRKDGQRFRLFLDIDPDPELARELHHQVMLSQGVDVHDPAMAAAASAVLLDLTTRWPKTVGSCWTEPICVLSKKKNHGDAHAHHPRARSHSTGGHGHGNGVGAARGGGGGGGSSTAHVAKRARVSDARQHGAAAGGEGATWATGLGGGGGGSSNSGGAGIGVSGGAELEVMMKAMQGTLGLVLEVVQRSETRLCALEGALAQLQQLQQLQHAHAPGVARPPLPLPPSGVLRTATSQAQPVEDSSDGDSNGDTEATVPIPLGSKRRPGQQVAIAPLPTLSLMRSRSSDMASLSRAGSMDLVGMEEIMNMPLRSASEGAVADTRAVELPFPLMTRAPSWGPLGASASASASAPELPAAQVSDDAVVTAPGARGTVEDMVVAQPDAIRDDEPGDEDAALAASSLDIVATAAAATEALVERLEV